MSPAALPSRPGGADELRVLFVHLSSDRVTPELRVHATLAEAAHEHGLRSTFLLPADLDDEGEVSTRAGIAVERIDAVREAGAGESVLRRRAGRVGHVARLVPRATGVRRSVRPHLVYTSQQRTDVAVARMLRVGGGATHVVHLHYQVGPWLGALTLRHIQASHHLIAVSESVRGSALLRGVDPSHVSTVHNPTTGRPVGGEGRLATRRELGIAEDAPVVIAAGRLDAGKGHEALLRAFEEACRKVPNAQLLVCGESSWGGDHRTGLEQVAAGLRVAEQVHFLGHRPDIRALLACADVFCLPAELEPFGLVYLEAMQAGLPVVAAWSGAVPEIVVHGGTGLLSSPNDVDQLAAHLSSLLTDAEMRTRLGAAGAERAAQTFSPERLGARWAAALRTIHDEVRADG